MAAAGLNIGSEVAKQNVGFAPILFQNYVYNSAYYFGQKNKQRADHCVVALVDFAFAMMTVLQSINKDCFNDFKLRVGITVGPVVAGLVSLP
jgi:hypothetical protein